MVERIVVGPMNTNAYIYSEWKKECIVIDPGGDPEKIIQHMSIKNLRPRGIALTHGHIDHVAAISKLKAHFHDLEIEVPVAIHEADRVFLGRAAARKHKKSLSHVDSEDIDYFELASKSLPSPDLYLEEGDHAFESDLLVIYTPGHTPGSICFYSESQEVLFSGDTLLFEGIGETALAGSDRKKLLESIRTKLFTLPHHIRLFPGHGPFTNLEREIRHNPYFNN